MEEVVGSNPTRCTMIMYKIIVYLKEDYSLNETLYLSGDLTKDEITKEVNQKYKEWYYYDII